MATGFAGQQARLFPWQMKHYLVRGGPFDPAFQTAGVAGSLTGGYLQVAQTITLPPVPGSMAGTPPPIPLPRVQSQISTGTYTTTTGVLATNTGGVYIGTIPGGSWIQSVEIFCYTALSAGTATSVGVFYTPADNINSANTPGLQPATLYALGVKLNPVAGTLYTSMPIGATANVITTSGALMAQLDGWQIGPGTGPSGSTWPTINSITLASDGPPGGQGFGGLVQGAAQPPPGDIDLYFVNYLIAGSGTANTAGNFEVKVEFTGLAG